MIEGVLIFEEVLYLLGIENTGKEALVIVKEGMNGERKNLVL